jgi:hypothetical protein
LIILDTNVLSALMQRQAEPIVVDWLDAQPADSIWVTSITVFEARYGIALLPDGERRSALLDRLDQLLQIDLADRVLLFDIRAAGCAADLAAARRARGRPVDMRDTMIAGIALAQGAALATRNLRHFADLAVPVVDPWADDISLPP